MFILGNGNNVLSTEFASLVRGDFVALFFLPTALLFIVLGLRCKSKLPSTGGGHERKLIRVRAGGCCTEDDISQFTSSYPSRCIVYSLRPEMLEILEVSLV